MKLTPPQVAGIFIGLLVYAAVIYGVDRTIGERQRVYYRYFAAILSAGIFFLGVAKIWDDHARCVDISKAGIAITAAACVFYEAHRAGMKKPVAERWKKFIGITLGVAAIVAYFNGFRFGYPKYYHRWDQFHYYMGAKYFREMGYGNLYKCGAIAQDELGVVNYIDEDSGKPMRVDMSKEVRHPDKKIRKLGGDNLLIPASLILDKPDEECKNGFTPERWSQFKEDIKFFRIASGKGYWEDMQKDHGYNPPPVWTIAGHYLAELHPASTGYLQFLAGFDLVYLAGMFAAIWWAFGWRVFAVAAIFWGCQSSAPFYWTGGAFLRQDWLFYLVLAACLARKRYFKLAGASMVYAGLLRIFPGLAVIGWLVVAGAYIWRHKRMAKSHQQMLLGGVLAAATLIPLSLHVAGRTSYQQFYEHTIQVHDHTPLTNHMGLRVLISHKFGEGTQSGRMKYVQDSKLIDPFEVWKRMREERYAKYRYVAYGIIALTLAFFIYVVRRARSMWVAQCLGQIWIIMLSQLTCYYYSFMILVAPLTKLKKGIEAPLFGFAALTQFIWMTFGYNDDRYTILTAVSLLFCYGLLCAFAPKSFFVHKLFGAKDEAEAPPDGALVQTKTKPAA